MMSTDTEMISKYLEEILNGVQDRENEELIQNVQQLADLSNFLLDKILCAQYQLNEQQSQHENELQSQLSEIIYHKQIVQQLQRIIQEDQVRTKQLYESLVTLEDDLTAESTNNILMSNQVKKQLINQLECVSSHNREHQTEQNRVISQKQLEIEQLKISLTYYRDMVSKLQTDKQVLQDNYIVELNTVQQMEQINQSLTSQLVQLKHELQNRGEDITNNNSIDYHQSKHHSILKEISSSPYILRSQRTSQKVLQHTSNNVYNKYSELQLDVKHFSIFDTDMTENQPPTAKFQQSKRNSIVFRRLDSIIGTESNISNTGRASRNPYQDFFNLICQCAKLNCKQMERILEVRTQHLFDEYIQKNIPYHKWYREVDRYLKTFI